MEIRHGGVWAGELWKSNFFGRSHRSDSERARAGTSKVSTALKTRDAGDVDLGNSCVRVSA
ncbi:hypothetical protein WN55_09399 [Dufourea novaeangliae]|uniref:Uncharacterized protein n=1 Tax=Dufourea novaeangliae TaxID=178035 RepID=A0A154P6B4_DUFNO|nr:hypothetical protein WN55_09399 [Dufourea novaeangliae]